MGVAFTTLGMRLAKGFTLDQHALEADAALGYRHAFGTVMPTTNENFVFGGAAFDTAGVLVPRNVALVSVGARARVTDSVKLGLGYIGQYGRGPTFLSFVIKDMSFCGGPYPSIGTMAIVYDLQTGAPVDWTQLLPPSLTWKVELTAGMDGTRRVTLASPKLYALYLAGYDQAARMPGSDIAADDLANCKEAVQGAADPPAMMVWLDAKSGGLAVQYHLAQAVQVGEFQRYYSCRRDKRRYLRC
jgi:Autotransporter beta-domain